MAARNLLRLPAVKIKSGLKTSAIYDQMAKGEFPRPVNITDHAVAWYEDEIEEWQATRPRVKKYKAVGVFVLLFAWHVLPVILTAVA
jgi:prophage regulatory protein